MTRALRLSGYAPPVALAYSVSPFCDGDDVDLRFASLSERGPLENVRNQKRGEESQTGKSEAGGRRHGHGDRDPRTTGEPASAPRLLGGFVLGNFRLHGAAAESDERLGRGFQGILSVLRSPGDLPRLRCVERGRRRTSSEHGRVAVVHEVVPIGARRDRVAERGRSRVHGRIAGLGRRDGSARGRLHVEALQAARHTPHALPEDGAGRREARALDQDRERRRLLADRSENERVRSERRRSGGRELGASRVRRVVAAASRAHRRIRARTGDHSRFSRMANEIIGDAGPSPRSTIQARGTPPGSDPWPTITVPSAIRRRS